MAASEDDTTAWRPALAGSALALSCALWGCATATAPPVRPTADLAPALWSGQARQANPTSLAAWWRRFGDPLLSQLVTEALVANPDIASAQARLRQARAQRDVTAAGLGPTSGGSASAQASRSEGRAATEQYRLGVDASWEPDLWGGTRAGVRAADAGTQASAATLAGTRVSIAAEVALDYLQLRGTQARLAIAKENLLNQQRTLQLTQWRAQAGLVSQLDVEQARTAVEQTRAQLPSLDVAITQSMNTLAVLTGRAPGALQMPLATAAPQPAAPPGLALSMPAEVLRQRPDVRAAEFQLVAASARVTQAEVDRLPSLSLGGSIGLNALSLGALGSGAGVASLLASVNLPLFDGGRRQAQVQVQAGARDEAEAAYRAAVLGALQEVEDALVAMRGTQAQLASQRQAAAAAQSAATLAEQRYASGLVDFQNVLQTQRTRLNAQDSVAASVTTLNIQHVRLYKALGGGWSPQADEITNP